MGKLYVFKKKKKKKEREKEKREKKEKLKGFRFIISKLVKELCYMLHSGDLDIFSSKRKKKEKKEKEEKDCWETFTFDASCWLNIAGTFKRKREKKKELFLKSY